MDLSRYGSVKARDARAAFCAFVPKAVSRNDWDDPWGADLATVPRAPSFELSERPKSPKAQSHPISFEISRESSELAAGRARSTSSTGTAARRSSRPPEKIPVRNFHARNFHRNPRWYQFPEFSPERGKRATGSSILTFTTMCTTPDRG